MLRKELRRHERRETFRRRLLAGSTAAILALGMAAGGAAPAFATPPAHAGGSDNGITCDKIGYEKPDSLDELDDRPVGTETFEWGTISWDGDYVEWTINLGYEVDLCVKGGNSGGPTELTGLTADDVVTDHTHDFDISHMGFLFGFDDDWRYADPTCDGITIVFPQNLPVGQQGVIEINARFDFGTLNYKVEGEAYTSQYPDGHAGVTLSVTWDDFRNGSVPDGPYTVEWIQVHGTNYHWEGEITCGDEGSDPTVVEPVAVKSTCATGGPSILLPPVVGVKWFVNDVETPGSLTPLEILVVGNYTVTVEIDPDAEGGPYAFAENAVTQWPFVFTVDDLCELGEETYTTASIGFTEPTCELGQSLDPTKLLVADDTLAELESYEEFPDGSYEVVFVTIDPNARFVENLTPTPGRTVSPDGTTLTFTGQLLGPDRSEACVTTVELTDPVTYVDTCVLGGSFTIYRIEGIAYTVFINDETPFLVEWADGEQTRTYKVKQGDSVRVEPSPESDRFTISPEPAPFERTFAVYKDDCLPTLPLTEGSVTFSPATCLDATNRVVLPTVVGVQWWIDGEPTAAGSWPMPAGDVVVEATPLQGYGFGLEAETLWEYTFPAADEACDLSSLAETGASNALVGIGFAAVLITIAGFGVVIGRRFQQA